MNLRNRVTVLIAGILALAGVYFYFQHDSAECQNGNQPPCNQGGGCPGGCIGGCRGGCGMMPLIQAVFLTGQGIAGFETGTRERFDPNDTSLWQGAARANNNPMNLRDAATGQFRRFQLPIQGWDAGIADLTAKFRNQTRTSLHGKYPNWSLRDLIMVWDSEDPDIASGPYSDYVAAVVGVNKDAPISSWVQFG